LDAVGVKNRERGLKLDLLTPIRQAQSLAWCVAVHCGFFASNAYFSWFFAIARHCHRPEDQAMLGVGLGETKAFSAVPPHL
jgi:hypothetical protein